MATETEKNEQFCQDSHDHDYLDRLNKLLINVVESKEEELNKVILILETIIDHGTTEIKEKCAILLRKSIDQFQGDTFILERLSKLFAHFTTYSMQRTNSDFSGIV